MLSRCLVCAVRHTSRAAAGMSSAAAAAPDLRTALAVKIPGFQEEVKAFRKDFGSAKVGWLAGGSLPCRWVRSPWTRCTAARG